MIGTKKCANFGGKWKLLLVYCSFNIVLMFLVTDNLVAAAIRVVLHQQNKTTDKTYSLATTFCVVSPLCVCALE